MAAPLSQDEIDALLNSSEDALDSDDPISDTDIDEPEQPKKSGIKNFEIPAIKPYRFKFNYHSPIIKCTNYVYNPEDDSNDKSENENLVVRSLFNYANRKKNCH